MIDTERNREEATRRFEVGGWHPPKEGKHKYDDFCPCVECSEKFWAAVDKVVGHVKITKITKKTKKGKKGKKK